MEAKKQIGEWISSGVYSGEIEKITNEGYIVKYWHNPRSGIGYEHHPVLDCDLRK